MVNKLELVRAQNGGWVIYEGVPEYNIAPFHAFTSTVDMMKGLEALVFPPVINHTAGEEAERRSVLECIYTSMSTEEIKGKMVSAMFPNDSPSELEMEVMRAEYAKRKPG